MVGYIIFADKNSTMVDAKYIYLFRDSEDGGKWLWTIVALVYLDHQLGYSDAHDRCQVGGI